MSEERDWRDLPPELLYLISQKLPDVCYFIRFRAACKTWRSSIPTSDHPQQIPWLIEYKGNFIRPPCFEEELRFCSLSSPETKTCSIPIKESHRNKKYHRPGNGYLLVVDGDELSLFNPLTNKGISIPPLPNKFSKFSPIFSSSDLIQNRLFVFSSGRQTIAIFHQDKADWKYIYIDSYYNCFLNGLLFTTISHCTLVFDATSGKKLYEIPPPRYKGIFSYLVESCGVISRVCLHYVRDAETHFFRIYRLDFEGGNRQPCWVEASNIGNQILFLDGCNGFSVRATAGFKENCIYWVNWYEPVNICTLWRYDIDTGEAERLPCPFDRFMWFIPNLC